LLRLDHRNRRCLASLRARRLNGLAACRLSSEG
jgi:hypothetical protein